MFDEQISFLIKFFWGTLTVNANRVCSRPRVNATYGLLQHALFAHSSIRVHHGKTQVLNRGGMVPAGVEVLQVVARVNDPDAVVSRGDPTLPSEQQSVQILGTPLGHPGFVRN